MDFHLRQRWPGGSDSAPLRPVVLSSSRRYQLGCHALGGSSRPPTSGRGPPGASEPLSIPPFATTPVTAAQPMSLVSSGEGRGGQRGQCVPSAGTHGARRGLSASVGERVNKVQTHPRRNAPRPRTQSRGRTQGEERDSNAVTLTRSPESRERGAHQGGAGGHVLGISVLSAPGRAWPGADTQPIHVGC